MKRASLRMSLRQFLLAIIVVGTVIAMWAGDAKRQQSVARRVCEFGGQVNYTAPFIPIPSGLLRLIGYDYFCRIDFVGLYTTEDNPADEQIQILRQVRHLRSLAIWPQGTNASLDSLDIEIQDYLATGYQHIPAAVNERDRPGGLSEAGLVCLLEMRLNLEQLSLSSARISPESPVYLEARKRIPTIEMNTHSSFDSERTNR